MTRKSLILTALLVFALTATAVATPITHEATYDGETCFLDYDIVINKGSFTFNLEEFDLSEFVSASISITTMGDGNREDWYLKDENGVKLGAISESSFCSGWVTDTFELTKDLFTDFMLTFTLKEYTGGTDIIFHDESRVNWNTEPVEIAPVPEPKTILLFGIGIIGLAWFARKKVVPHANCQPTLA